MTSSIRDFFTSEEIEEIRDLEIGLEGLVVDDSKAIGRDVLRKLITNEVAIERMSRKELLMAYAQVKALYEFWHPTSWLDTRTLKSVVSKFRHIVNDELRSRKH